ncbi:MAG: hypothetical protein COB37_01625 [Kordiimonadales bacterium]|nr:MAG: hypothetical protein COB37_01625 [Kordiimonadales bacterium]
MKNRISIAGATLAGLLLAPGSLSVAAAAEKLEQTLLLKLSLEELLRIKVTVANRSKTKLSDAPSSVTLFTQYEIQRMGVSSLEELLNYVPGFMSSRNDRARTSAVVARGRRIDANAPDILVMIDGIRLNDPVIGGGFYSSSQLSLVNVKQVEIIRGPGSALYGSNAFSGVINIVTNKDERAVSVRGGENGLREATVKFSQVFGDLKLSLFARDYRDSGQTYAPIIEYFGHFDPLTDPGSGRDLQLNLGYKKLSLTVGLIDRLYRGFVQGGIPGDGVNKLDRTAQFYRLKYDTELSGNFSTSFYLEYLRVTQDELVLILPADIAALPLLGWTNNAPVDFIGGNNRAAADKRAGFDATWTLNSNHQLQLGAVYQQESTGLNAFQGNWNSEQMRLSDGAVRVPSLTGIEEGFWIPGSRLDLILAHKRDITGLYLQDQWQINNKLNLTAGLRYDGYQGIGDSLSLRAGLVYSIGENQRLKLLYGEAFRAPSIADTNAEFSSSVVGNPALQPELIKTIDIIWQKSWASIAVTANAFFSRIENEVVVELRQPIPGLNAQQLVNKGRRHLSGLELELQADVSKDIFVKAGLSYFTRFQKLGGARAQAFFIVNYQTGDWNVNLNGYFHDRVLSRTADTAPDGEAVYLDGFWKLNGRIRYQITDKLSLAIKAENLLNTRYTTYSPSAGLEAGLPERGRQISAALEWSF